MSSTRHAVLASSLSLAAGLLLASAPAAAQSSEAWHFQSDPTRHARVDDRGGLGEGYSFSIEYDPSDGNSEDFCPHCRLSVLTSDPGIDLAELERVGVQRGSLASLESTVSTLQSVVSADPTGLAAMLSPELTGADLAARIEEIRRIQDELVAVLAALDRFASLQVGSFDWASATTQGVVDLLSLRMDTAFRADFSDVNDPRRHNSGVAVYGLPQLVSGLAAQGLPSSVTSQIESSLSSIPGLSGAVELSGDDDDVLSPAVFHGYHTDLTIRQRTFVVNGHSAYLVVYTVANETSRVFPLVEAAMMADFDIPPLSYDTATDFDPANQAVLVYDTVPYTDPEQHYWFGVAPATLPTPTPTGFVFTHWNQDRNMTLAQQGTDVTQDNRYRFFLFDPALAGDHDDAIGKSEKQGAINMLLSGPLLPGDQRTVAFCFAAGEGTSSGAARAELTAILTGCRTLYSALNPTCGDGVAYFPEECDAPGSADCSATCHRIECGDGRLDGAEECDDGNTTADDGCSPTCRRERCGNGIVEGTEECDDGNDSNVDRCSTDCRAARCGDGFVRTGEGCTGADCGCAGYDHCLSGSFTLDTAAAGTEFAPLVGVPVSYRIGFDVASTDTTTLAATSGVRVTTGPLHVEMTGHALAGRLASSFTGRTWTLDLVARPARLQPRLSTTRLTGPYARTTAAMQVSAVSSTAVAFSLDASGRPLLSTLRITAGQVTLSLGAVTATDVATGPLRGTIGTVPAGDAGELCDDGNASDFDACTSACIPARCGDGIVQASLGEQCDLGPTPPAWCTGCRRTGSSCGNGTVEDAFGEECDDGNVADGDGCGSSCRTERCGDGVVQPTEACDDGANGAGDGCTDDCVVERCGDGVVQPAEDCDDGPANGDTAACTSACRSARCGDGLVRAGVEQCDDGNELDGDGCSALCANERCGDGRPGPDEDCDDGNEVVGDGCTPSCRYEVCGDALPGPEEQCDDGNFVDGDGCDKDCRLEDLAACGDGSLDPGEQCDDGGRSLGDGCDAFCQLEDRAACGDGDLDPGEQCDDGNDRGGDGCTAFCTAERCGDGLQAAGEECDDGNELDGDGCSALCHAEPASCGNGRQEYGEQCDGGAGCSASCEATDPAPLGETCGNGLQEYGEQCDDGGRMDGNGCDATCQLEATVCGNARLERGETCDDGNARDGDGCDSRCRPERAPGAVCGDGHVDPGEACDDGNARDGDGCDSRCRHEATPSPDAGCGAACDARDAGATTDAAACEPRCDAGPARAERPADDGGCSAIAGARTRGPRGATALLLLALALVLHRRRR